MLTTHFSVINQSLGEQDCHFLDKCWKISSAMNLCRRRRPGFYSENIELLHDCIFVNSVCHNPLHIPHVDTAFFHGKNVNHFI